MATTKNITMKQFNGTDYDTLYPKTKVEQVEGAYTQQQILANSTKALYGLDSGAVPNDVFVAIKTMFDGRVRIASGTYTGTGVYGENNKNSLTFPFAPEVLFLYRVGDIGVVSGTSSKGSSGYYAILPKQTTAFTTVVLNDGFGFQDRNYISFSEKTVTWYMYDAGFKSAEGQFNESGTTYGYIIIGGGDY